MKSREHLLTLAECAERLRISRRALRAKVNGGVIPAIRLNQRVWRFHWPTVLDRLSRS